MSKYFSPTKTTIAFFLFLPLSVLCHAEVLTLLSGKTVTGKIILRNEEMIRMETSFGIPVTYYLDEIRLIDGRPVSLLQEDDLSAELINLESISIMEATPQPPLFPTKNISPVVETPVRQETAPATKIKPVEKLLSLASLEGINIFQPAPPSPAAIKPSEAQSRVTDVTDTAAFTEPAPAEKIAFGDNFGRLCSLKTQRNTNRMFFLNQFRGKHYEPTSSNFFYPLGKRYTFLRNKNHKTFNRNILVLISLFLAALYMVFDYIQKRRKSG